MNSTTTDNGRTLSAIASDIIQSWPTMPESARVYVMPMRTLTDITDTYGADDAEMVVRYFLSNAQTWRGDDARRIKAELKTILKRVK